MTKRTRKDRLKAKKKFQQRVTEPLEILKWDHPLLKEALEEVPDYAASRELAVSISRMVATCQKAKGAGLAANQVGIKNRVIVVPESPNPLP